MLKGKSTTVFLILLLIVINDAHLSENRIVNGFIAGRSQFPWNVKLKIKKVQPINGWRTCGGSIISHFWVLTAAHCLENSLFAKLYLGTTKLNKKYQKNRSVKLIAHPNFGRGVLKRDIGLIKVKDKIIYDKFIRPIRLPKKSMTNKHVLNKICLTCGFGKYNTTNRKQGRNLLRFAVVKVVSKKHCKYHQKDIICAKAVYNHANICFGDSGGGLFLYEKGKNYVVGITALTSPTCVAGPAGFESVRSNLRWISKITKIKIKK